MKHLSNLITQGLIWCSQFLGKAYLSFLHGACCGEHGPQASAFQRKPGSDQPRGAGVEQHFCRFCGKRVTTINGFPKHDCSPDA